jgi:hypothetical protein
MAEDERDLSRRFEVLCDITRAQHFAWREAVARTSSADAAERAVMEMWRVTGTETAAAYRRRLDTSAPIAPQLAAAIVWSSRCMGEDAVAEPGAFAHEAFVRHRACPWKTWHERKGLLAEDRPGCDAWFGSICRTLGDGLGRRVTFETLESLPDGGASCLRRLRVEP